MCRRIRIVLIYVGVLCRFDLVRLRFLLGWPVRIGLTLDGLGWFRFGIWVMLNVLLIRLELVSVNLWLLLRVVVVWRVVLLCLWLW